jgi:hypothetical protein
VDIEGSVDRRVYIEKDKDSKGTVEGEFVTGLGEESKRDDKRDSDNA